MTVSFSVQHRTGMEAVPAAFHPTAGRAYPVVLQLPGCEEWRRTAIADGASLAPLRLAVGPRR